MSNGKYTANFVDELQGAADFVGNGAIEVNMYESEITDLVRRRSTALARMPRKLATGHPHRYWEATAIATAGFTDPRNISPTASGPTRVERAAYIKAITCQSNFSRFDVEVTKQQGQFSGIEAQDIADITNAIVLTSATALWAGTDTSLILPTTSQYMGLLSQITQQSTVGPGASIIDGLKAEVAAMLASTTYAVMPTAIYVNPILGDLIDREAKAAKIELGTTNIAAGVTVNAINTQAGTLPLIPDPFLASWTGSKYGFSAPSSGNKFYPAVILTEDMVEMPVITEGGNLMPRIFHLGLLAGLQAQYVGIMFDCVIAKGPGYAHATVAVDRP